MSSSELQETAARHGMQIPPDQAEQLEAYRQQLLAWNERLNLTRHVDLETFVTRDLLDSWQLAQLLNGEERVLDVGTGGGVPGVVVAILRPDLRVTVCDSIAKKAAAVQAMVTELALPVTVMAGRVDQVLAQRRFETLVARAVGPMWKMLKWVHPAWNRFDRLLLIKGPKWVEERGEARHRGYLKGLALRRLASYPTPGHYGESVVLSIMRGPDNAAEDDELV